MNTDSINKKQSEAQLTLYRLLRLQNRENNFIYRDIETGTQLRVSYQHFPLETIGHGDLLKTFWKFITTHYFKKIDQEEFYRLNYIRNLFKNRIVPRLPGSIRQLHLPLRFFRALNDLLQPGYLQQVYNDYQDSIDGRMHLKSLYLNWAGEGYKIKKEKKIRKLNLKYQKPRGRPGVGKRERQLSQRQKEVDKMISQLQLSQRTVQQRQRQQQSQSIDDEIARLEILLQSNAETNIDLLQQLESRLYQEQQQVQNNQRDTLSGTDAKCLEWLIHNLEQKQIAQSVAKIVTTERKDSESKFIIHYEKALNLMPQLISQRSLKKMNQLRETSLLKYYRTAVKSTRSYICHNYAGFSQITTHSSTLQRNKEKDHLQMMKKMGPASHDIKQSMEQFDICHHCKFLYLPQFLVTCKLVSDRPCMPKISETETDFAQDLSTLYLKKGLQKGRVSQRFVAKHRNCLTGYAHVNEQFVCGRKFCLSCLKDNYGQNWMRSSNGICPFCEGICSCTRCLRNQKMNKLKAFFLSLGGDLNKLQEESLIDRLPCAKNDLPLKISSRMKQPLKVLNYSKSKQIKKRVYKVSPRKQGRNNRKYLEKSQKKSDGSQQLEKWSSTAEKEVQKTILWRRSSRRYTPKIY